MWADRSIGSRGAGHDEPGLVRDDDELGAITSCELGQDPADVGLGRERADHERLCDVGVAPASSDLGERVALTCGESSQYPRIVGGDRAAPLVRR